MDWSQARGKVESFWMNDTVALYIKRGTENEIGEDEMFDSYLRNVPAHVEYGAFTKQREVTSYDNYQTLRVAMPKSTALSRNKQMSIKVLAAPLNIDPEQFWDIVDYVEGQLSIVANCKLRTDDTTGETQSEPENSTSSPDSDGFNQTHNPENALEIDGGEEM